ncbi:Spherulation-specific 4 family protein [Aspergillus niger]|nr:Spherulation-specific 4 family protein [Aspergillus niger]
MTMQQPSAPEAPVTEQVVTGQPGQQETMQMNLRGGGEGEDVCCGVCAGLACFECCECCC